MSNTGTMSNGTGVGVPTTKKEADKATPQVLPTGPTPPPISQKPQQAPPAVVVQQPRPQPMPPVPPTANTPEDAVAKVTKKKTPKATRSPRSPNNGRVSSEVTTIPSMRAIWREHAENGTSYERIEEHPRFNLKKANGMTAYRICRKYEKMTGTKPKPAKRGRPKSKNK